MSRIEVGAMHRRYGDGGTTYANTQETATLNALAGSGET